MPRQYSGLKHLFVILCMPFLLLCAYIGYRYVELPKKSSLSSITSVARIKTAVCSVSTGNSKETAEGQIYIWHGVMREDLTVQTDRFAKTLHAILNDENNGTLYSWFEGETHGTVTTHVFDQGPFQVSVNDLNCSPWWLPSDTLLTVPTDVGFTPAQ